MSEHLLVSKDKGRAIPEISELQPNAEEIERLAHRYFPERGSPGGTPVEEWFRAAEEMRLRWQEVEHEGSD